MIRSVANANDHPGRLEPVEKLVRAATGEAADLGTLLAAAFPGLSIPPQDMVRMSAFVGELSPPGMGGSGAAVWHDTGLFAVSSELEPMLSVDGGDSTPMASVSGTSYWLALETVETGMLHKYRFGVDGEWGPSSDVAGYSTYSYELPKVRAGTISESRAVASEIYPGATTEYWVYTNHGIDQARGAPLMVWHDGESCLEPGDLFRYRMQIVTDNLVHLGLIPPMVHILVNPSTGGEGKPMTFGAASERYSTTMRGIQYDTVSDRYGHHIIDEVLPDVEKFVKLRRDAYSRGSAGASSGGLCAFKLAWFQPEEFSRVHSVIGGFSGLRWDPEQDLIGGFMVPHLVRREPKRNIRIWISDGMNDLELNGERGCEVFQAGSLPLHNIMLANALKGKGYDFHFRFGDGFHAFGQAGLDLPESLAWLWRGYDPDRTEQAFEQELAERELPVYRVRIVNRDAH